MAGSRQLKTFVYDARGFDGLGKDLHTKIDADVAAFLTAETALEYDGTAIVANDDFVVVSILWSDAADV